MTARRTIRNALRHAVLTPLGRVLLIGCLVIALAAPAAATFPASPAWPGAVGFELYVSNPTDDPAGQRLTPLDPLTLADRRDAAVIELGSAPSFWLREEDQDPSNFWIPSADGSTLLGAEYAATNLHDGLQPVEVTFVIRDGRTGSERARFHPPGSVWSSTWPRLSGDGSLLAIEGFPDRPASSGGGLVWWYVMDTRDGRPVATIEAAEPDHWGYWLDPARQRLYYLAAPRGPQSSTQPPPVRIVAHDLTTGDEVGRVVLPDVPFGGRETAQGGWAEEHPGVTLSPDGRQVAVVRPDRSAVILIETERLTVERTVVLRQPASVLERLVGLLPLVPKDAAAKPPDESTNVNAVYGPDGRRLYLDWHEYRADDIEQPRRTGLAVVDLASGTILAEMPADDDSWLGEIMPAPDGRSVYVYAGELGGDGRWLLQRRDASTLEILAEREFDGYRWFMVRPAPPDE